MKLLPVNVSNSVFKVSAAGIVVYNAPLSNYSIFCIFYTVVFKCLICFFKVYDVCDLTFYKKNAGAAIWLSGCCSDTGNIKKVIR